MAEIVTVADLMAALGELEPGARIRLQARAGLARRSIRVIDPDPTTDDPAYVMAGW